MKRDVNKSHNRSCYKSRTKEKKSRLNRFLFNYQKKHNVARICKKESAWINEFFFFLRNFYNDVLWQKNKIFFQNVWAIEVAACTKDAFRLLSFSEQRRKEPPSHGSHSWTLHTLSNPHSKWLVWLHFKDQLRWKLCFWCVFFFTHFCGILHMMEDICKEN